METISNEMAEISNEMAERVFNVLVDAIKLLADKDCFISEEAFHTYVERALNKYFSNQIKE